MASWDINEWVCSGNLTKDAELKYTPNGSPILNFGVAVNGKPNDKGDVKTNFFNCVMWGKGGEALAQYMTKGKPVILKGHPEQQSWKESKTGENRSRIVLIVDRVKFQVGQNSNKENNKQEFKSNENAVHQSGNNQEQDDWIDIPEF